MCLVTAATSREIQDKITTLADGNAEALSALYLITEGVKINAPYEPGGSMSFLMLLEDLHIRGNAVHVLYKDICKCNTVKVIALLYAVCLGLLSEDDLKNSITVNPSLEKFAMTYNCFYIVREVRSNMVSFARNYSDSDMLD